MKILITGIAGFIGAWLASLLSRYGYEVFGIDMEDNKLRNEIFLKGCVIEIFDITDKDRLNRFLTTVKPEIIIHMAASPIVSDSINLPEKTLTNNIVGTLNVLDYFYKSEDTRKFICTTSDKCYKNTEQNFLFSEGDALGAADPYSSSKAIQEILCETYANLLLGQTKRIYTLRLGNVLGGGDLHSSRILPSLFLHKFSNRDLILRNIDAVRPWQNVLDVVRTIRAIVERLEINNTNFYCYNVGGTADNKIHRVKDMLDILEIINYSIADFGYDKRYLQISTEKIEEELGCIKQYSFLETLKQCNKWYELYYNAPNELSDYTNRLIDEVICFENIDN